MTITTLRVVFGLLVRGDDVLLVATRYPDRAEALWNLPGGRARPGELLPDALRREIREETGLEVRTARFAYLTESFDPVGGVHVSSATFEIEAPGEPARTDDPSIADLAWVPRDGLAARIAVRVVREPLIAHLAGEGRPYTGYADAGITIRFATEP